MKTQSMLLAALASAPAALAHTVFTDFYVDGVPQGDGVAMRMSPHPDTAGSPIASLDSEDMACNVGGTKGVSRVQSVSDGALLTFEFREWANDASKGAIDRGHYGPCAVYLKKVDSAVDDQAAGDGWFKLFDHGYDSSTQRWCTDEIVDNNGLLSVNLPKGLEGGYYLARPEILALHNANKGDPQFYTGCAQIFLESTGDLVPESTVSIPGYVSYDEPSTSFDIWNNDHSKYTELPGPSVAKLTARGAQFGGTAQVSQAEGLKPAGCIAENANWCGEEVPDYSSESGCWSSAENCWAQGEKCYESSPPTGNAGCELWQTKCKGIQDQCSSGNFNGPPNKGKVLTPEKNAIDVGMVMATVGGGVVDTPIPKTSATQKEEAKTSSPAKPTPVAEEEYTEEETKPPAVPAKSTSAAAAAPKPTVEDAYETTPKQEEPEKEEDDEEPVTPSPAKTPAYEAPVHTITVAPSSAGAPAPTGAAEACPKGWACVTVTQWEVVTTTVYVTATAGYDSPSYRKRATVHRRRHAHRL